jgi:hypothetical protein
MGTVNGNMNPDNCYPACCTPSSGCSIDFCFHTDACGPDPQNTCSQGSCGTCNNNLHSLAYAKLTDRPCDQTGGCRPLPALPCNQGVTLRDQNTGLSIGANITDCGPNQFAVCNLNFIGCMSAQAWLDTGHSSPGGGPDACCLAWAGDQCPF